MATQVTNKYPREMLFVRLESGDERMEKLNKPKEKSIVMVSETVVFKIDIISLWRLIFPAKGEDFEGENRI